MGGSTKIFLRWLHHCPWKGSLLPSQAPFVPTRHLHLTCRLFLWLSSLLPFFLLWYIAFVNAPNVGRHGLTFGTTVSPFTPIDFVQLQYIWCFIALYFWMPWHITFSICFSLLWSYVFHPLSSSACFCISFLLSFIDGLYMYLIYPRTHMQALKSHFNIFFSCCAVGINM